MQKELTSIFFLPFLLPSMMSHGKLKAVYKGVFVFFLALSFSGCVPWPRHCNKITYKYYCSRSQHSCKICPLFKQLRTLKLYYIAKKWQDEIHLSDSKTHVLCTINHIIFLFSPPSLKTILFKHQLANILKAWVSYSN